ncbi:hypothetical protein Tco_1291446 [Tanacetum coccineum]
MVKNLEGGVKFLMYPRFVQMFLDKQVEGISKHKETYVTPSHTKKVFANMKRQGKDFSGRDTPLFPTMMVEEVGEGLANSTDPHHIPTTTQPSTSQPQKKQKPRRKQIKGTKIPSSSGEPLVYEAANKEHVPTYSNDPLLSGEDRLKLNELMEICTNLQTKILDLETSKTAQAQEISSLKQRVEHLEKKKKSRPHGLKRLYKEKKIDEIDQDAEVTLVDETQGRNGDNLMFDNGVLDNEEVFVEHDMAEKEVDIDEKNVSTSDPVTTAGEVATTANVEVSTARPTEAIIADELTLSQTLIEIKAAKPKAVTTAATITTTVVTRPKARGVIVQDPCEFTTTTSPSHPSQLPQTKDKGKAKMIEPEMPLKKKDQIMIDKEVAQKPQAQLEDELEEEKKLATQKEEDANIVEWDDVQAMIDADYELAARLQAKEQRELTIKEKSRLFVELMDKRKKHFAKLRAEEQRRKPPTKAQKRRKHGYKHNQLKNKTFEDIQMLFDKEMKRVNIFVDMDTELVKGSKTRAEGSSKRAGEELESENLKKQKLDENVEAEVDDDQEEAEMKKHMEIVPDDEVAIDAIPLATKPPIIMLQNIDREDLETLRKLMKAKHGSTRPEEGYERVLWGDLKVMFEPDVESDILFRSVEESTRTQSDSLEAIFFMWSTFCEVSKSAYLYAGREGISSYTCNNHRHAK